MLINETCDLSCSLALPFDFQLAGKNSYFLNNSTETKNRKEGAFVAIKTHGRPPALALTVPVSLFQCSKLTVV